MSLIYQAREMLFAGTLVTIEITMLAAILVVAMSFMAGLARLSRSWIVRTIALIYIELFRGVALLVQLFWLFFVLPLFGIYLEPITTAVIGLGLCNGAYGAEIVRSAVQAVPRGQVDAAVALNYDRFQRMRKIILPQAIPMMIPPFGNLTIELLKATALVSLITIQDLSFQALTLRTTTMKTVEPFALVLIVYFLIAMCISLVFRSLEKRIGVGLDRGGVR
jgi:polar amino acid transport system permease protein